MKVLVVGAGAVGALYGSKLASVGIDVSCVCRSDYKEVSKNGFVIQNPDGSKSSFRPIQVVQKVDDYEGVPDLLFVCTKALPEIDSVGLLASKILPETSIMLLQNGINNEDILKSAYPKNALISGLAFVCVSKLKPGYIHHQDYGRLVLGDYPSGCSELTKTLAQYFEKAGVPTRVTENIQLARWKKMIWNAPFNPLSVILGGKTTDELLRVPAVKQRIKEIMQEIAQIAAFEGYDIDDVFIEKNISDTEKMVSYKTSMLLDYEHKRPLEVDAILVNAIKIANKHDLDVPQLQLLWDEIRVK